MKNLKLSNMLSLVGMIFLSYLLSPSLQAQQHDTLCSQFGDAEFITTASFVYGSVANSKSSLNRTDVVIGQPVMSIINSGLDSNTFLGHFAQLKQAPASPFLSVSQGDYQDRVQLDWALDKFSPPVEEYRIYRDDAFLGKYDKDVFEYIDFNVQAGEIYTYSIESVSANGLSSVRNEELGFVNPNGVVTGRIQTKNGNPVPNAVVTIEPVSYTHLTLPTTPYV